MAVVNFHIIFCILFIRSGFIADYYYNILSYIGVESANTLTLIKIDKAYDLHKQVFKRKQQLNKEDFTVLLEALVLMLKISPHDFKLIIFDEYLVDFTNKRSIKSAQSISTKRKKNFEFLQTNFFSNFELYCDPQKCKLLLFMTQDNKVQIGNILYLTYETHILLYKYFLKECKKFTTDEKFINMEKTCLAFYGNDVSYFQVMFCYLINFIMTQ
ncbi:hypothetical protein AAJ76_4400021997 [Vairimorpha ceranae]|uniref:Uncharacterized protein n=1 Tax=Vairimorpha ceranae TaxID=40302 RepID=A0A0F9ZAH7_9MICR|nr:hypothetical protein AAJ76_4400021997 [Vairimorpha ceranae]KAF5139766.1 hypothetical protein G9O61_00g020800 [Vairimorpha ceranae]KKO74809.1 hypothetical protein AAJ76_4400021997 [Vairimorpha ceranae]